MKPLFQIINGISETWEFDAAKNLFRKEIAKTGKYIDRHGQKVELTEGFMDELIKNFKSEENVPIPLGHEGMSDPTKNTGFVAGLERIGKSLFALMNIKSQEVADKIKEGTIKGVSIGVMLSEAAGKVLGHIALTLQPSISNLADFVALEKYDVRIYELEKEVDGEEAIIAEGGAAIIDVLTERHKNNT